MEILTLNLEIGISPTKEFEKKRMAEYAVNIGLKCGHSCEYCSTGAMLRTHNAFKELGVSPFENNYAVIDPDTPNRIARDASRKRQRGLVQLCTIVDAWSPEAQQFCKRFCPANKCFMAEIIEEYKNPCLFESEENEK